jgi:uncharacterized damage-inducible protein DinB
MSADLPGVWRFYQGWDTHQKALITAISPLTPLQLALRSAPHLRSVGENCCHIIGARSRWFQSMGIGDAAFAEFGQWDRVGMPERSTSEIVDALRQSWQVVQDTLQRWTPDDLAFAYLNTDPEPDEPASFTRQWIIWHLIEHDIHHGGDISQILGMHGLPGIDL